LAFNHLLNWYSKPVNQTVVAIVSDHTQNDLLAISREHTCVSVVGWRRSSLCAPVGATISIGTGGARVSTVARRALVLGMVCTRADNQAQRVNHNPLGISLARLVTSQRQPRFILRLDSVKRIELTRHFEHTIGILAASTYAGHLSLYHRFNRPLCCTSVELLTQNSLDFVDPREKGRKPFALSISVQGIQVV
jgi:hypothetical protein